jgi:hypothetical protein
MARFRRLTGLAGLGVAVVIAASAAAQSPGSSTPTTPAPAGGPDTPPQPPPPPDLPAARSGPIAPGSTAPQAGPQTGPGSPTPLSGSIALLQTADVLGGINAAEPRRFPFKIDPKTPVKDLLPTPPQVRPIRGPVRGDRLADVPEVEFQARSGKITNVTKEAEAIAHQLAKMTHLNGKKTDAFLTALLESRADLAGMPFAMGDACRTSGDRLKQFTIAVNTVRQALGGNRVAFNVLTGPQTGSGFGPGGPPPGQPGGSSGPGGPGMPGGGFAPQPVPPGGGGPFWTQYPLLCEQQDAAQIRPDKALREHVMVARIAALMQMLAAESADMRLGLVKYLMAVPHAEATRALAKLVIFSPEDDVRAAAIEALKVRREKDYTDVLLKGLRYPWPAVADHAAEAIVKMERTDLIPELVTMLSAGDPRLPSEKKENGQTVPVVREMVKVNHHRNCMMCHSSSAGAPADAISAQVPVPGEPLPSPQQGYQSSSPDLMIRVDVTYLRQDFSASLAVAEATPWPDHQRFDFFVRERNLTKEEAAVYRDQLTPKETGVLSPYHKAAVKALRDLTGKDTAPTAEAWRRLLGTSARRVE